MAKSGGGEGKDWYEIMIGTVINSPISAMVLDKFSQLKSGEPQLKFCIKKLQQLGASLDISSDRVKNNEKAEEFRNIGNDLFSSNGDTVKVAEMYTKSIAYALPGSRELALGYANRSAVSFKAEDYEECLLDIERSFENNYPEEMRAKLHARKVRCLLALKKPQTEIEKALQDTRVALLKMDLKASGRNLVEKTLTDENHMAPTPSKRKKHSPMKPPVIKDDSCDIRGATGITIKYSKKYGRHIVATKDIRPGEIIGVIENYAHVRSPEKYYRECNYCTEITSFGIPCDHCVNIVYCSTSCRDKAWKDYHENECPILGLILEMGMPETVMLSVRITLKALREAGSVIELKKLVKRIDSVSDPRVKGFTGNVFDTTKYACFYTLASHAGKRADESYLLSVIVTFAISFLATRTEIFGRKYSSDLKGFDTNPLLIFVGGLMIRNCEIVQMTVTGMGEDVQIAPFTALCNHSCDSNMTSVGTHESIVYALQPIKAGDQLWDTYGHYHYSSFPKEQRQTMLKNHYHFTCNCVPCIENWPMFPKLPRVYEVPGLSHSIKTQISGLQKIFSKKYKLSRENEDMFAAKEELVQLIELLFEHACPCKEITTFRDTLKEMFGLNFTPNQCVQIPKRF